MDIELRNSVMRELGYEPLKPMDESIVDSAIAEGVFENFTRLSNPVGYIAQKFITSLAEGHKYSPYLECRIGRTKDKQEEEDIRLTLKIQEMVQQDYLNPAGKFPYDDSHIGWLARTYAQEHEVQPDGNAVRHWALQEAERIKSTLNRHLAAQGKPPSLGCYGDHIFEEKTPQRGRGNF